MPIERTSEFSSHAFTIAQSSQVAKPDQHNKILCVKHMFGLRVFHGELEAPRAETIVSEDATKVAFIVFVSSEQFWKTPWFSCSVLHEFCGTFTK